MIISVDHGNKSIKTPNTLFTSGLISSEGLQGFKTDYICWNGRYYGRPPAVSGRVFQRSSPL